MVTNTTMIFFIEWLKNHKQTHGQQYYEVSWGLQLWDGKWLFLCNISNNHFLFRRGADYLKDWWILKKNLAPCSYLVTIELHWPFWCAMEAFSDGLMWHFWLSADRRRNISSVNSVCLMFYFSGPRLVSHVRVMAVSNGDICVWTCTRCSYASNPSWSKHCDLCNQAKDNQLPASKRRWICDICTILNHAAFMLCDTCGTEKTRTAPLQSNTLKKGEYWSCSKCTLKNSIHQLKCKACDSVRVTIEGPKSNSTMVSHDGTKPLPDLTVHVAGQRAVVNKKTGRPRNVQKLWQCTK
jgi:hypothetical protein